MLKDREIRIGAFSGLVACILVLALTAMAFNALDPPRPERHAFDISMSEPAPSSLDT